VSRLKQKQATGLNKVSHRPSPQATTIRLSKTYYSQHTMATYIPSPSALDGGGTGSGQTSSVTSSYPPPYQGASRFDASSVHGGGGVGIMPSSTSSAGSISTPVRPGMHFASDDPFEGLSSSGKRNKELSSLLRECANAIDRNDNYSSTKLFKLNTLLQEYTVEMQNSETYNINKATNNNSSSSNNINSINTASGGGGGVSGGTGATFADAPMGPQPPSSTSTNNKGFDSHESTASASLPAPPIVQTNSLEEAANQGAANVKKVGKLFGKTLNSAFKGTEKAFQSAAAKVHKPGNNGSSRANLNVDLYQAECNDDNPFTGTGGTATTTSTSASTSTAAKHDNTSDEWGSTTGAATHDSIEKLATAAAAAVISPSTAAAQEDPSLPSVSVVNAAGTAIGGMMNQSQGALAPPNAEASIAGTAASRSSTTSASASSGFQSNSGKPCFQRPINKMSNLIANGWIEQQRRSKMRVVWKDILASLVEGRKPKEETTLWIQRQGA
jgi:hypothetical protein